MSQKKAIVDKIIERLTGLEAINPDPNYPIDIFKNPFRPVEPDDLPCLKVAIMRGKTERITNSIEYAWTDQLIVAYQTKGNDNDLEDDLYKAAEAISDFLIKDENNSGDPDSLHHLISDLVLTDWDMDLKNGEVGVGAIVLKFDLTYHIKYELVFPDLEGFEIIAKLATAGQNTDPAFTESLDLPTG